MTKEKEVPNNNHPPRDRSARDVDHDPQHDSLSQASLPPTTEPAPAPQRRRPARALPRAEAEKSPESRNARAPSDDEYRDGQIRAADTSYRGAADDDRDLAGNNTNPARKSQGPKSPDGISETTHNTDPDTLPTGELGQDPKLDVRRVATGDVDSHAPTPASVSSPAELAIPATAPADPAAGNDRGDEIDHTSTARETPDATLPTTPEPRAEVAKPPSIRDASGIPGVLVGHETAAVGQKVEGFYRSVATMFEAWIARRKSENTRRAYRRDVMDFVEFLGIQWPSIDAQGRIVGVDESWKLLQATVPSVQAWRDYLLDERNLAPNTLNRRVSSLSGFYRFLRESAAEMRLPITVPNPAHSQFISREVQEPVTPTEALSPTRARQLIALPDGEGVIASRDRAVLKFYLYSGCRIGTGCRLNVEDFIDDDEDPKIRIQEKGKGKSKRALGINAIAADALREYIDRAGLVSGPLFRPRSSSKGEELAARRMEVSTMYRLVQSYLVRLPKAMREHELEDGRVETRCIYSPHSIRATTATVLLDAGEDIRDVQKLLGHKHVTVTQVYDKRRRGTKDSASHRLSV